MGALAAPSVEPQIRLLDDIGPPGRLRPQDRRGLGRRGGERLEVLGAQLLPQIGRLERASSFALEQVKYTNVLPLP